MLERGKLLVSLAGKRAKEQDDLEDIR